MYSTILVCSRVQVKYTGCTASKFCAMQEDFRSSWQLAEQFAVAVTQNANIAKLRSKFCFAAFTHHSAVK